MLAHAASAAQPQPSAVAAAYPLTVRLSVSKEALRERLAHTSGGLLSPPNPSCVVDIGTQARDAYAAAVARMFRASDAPAAEFEVSRAAAELGDGADGWYAAVEHVLILRTVDGKELGRWTVRARERLVGLGEGAIPAALRRAAVRAARTFEHEFARPPAVVEWLRGAGVEVVPEPQADAVKDPLAAPRAITLPRPQRGAGLHVDAGMGVIPYAASYQRSYRDFGLPPYIRRASGEDTGSAFRVGFSGRWALLQLAWARWHPSLDEYPVFEGSIHMSSFGADAAPVLRLGHGFELAAGVGWHRISLRSNSSDSAATFRDSIHPLSVFAHAHFVFPSAPRSFRLRMGVEARRYFDAVLQVLPPVDGGAYRDSREIEFSNIMALFIGLEVPLGRPADERPSR
jgi:hypothetical protein